MVSKVLKRGSFFSRFWIHHLHCVSAFVVIGNFLRGNFSGKILAALCISLEWSLPSGITKDAKFSFPNKLFADCQLHFWLVRILLRSFLKEDTFFSGRAFVLWNVFHSIPKYSIHWDGTSRDLSILITQPHLQRKCTVLLASFCNFMGSWLASKKSSRYTMTLIFICRSRDATQFDTLAKVRGAVERPNGRHVNWRTFFWWTIDRNLRWRWATGIWKYDCEMSIFIRKSPFCKKWGTLKWLIKRNFFGARNLFRPYRLITGRICLLGFGTGNIVDKKPVWTVDISKTFCCVRVWISESNFFVSNFEIVFKWKGTRGGFLYKRNDVPSYYLKDI